MIKRTIYLLSSFKSGVSLLQVLMTSSAIAGLALVGLKLAEDQRILVENTYQRYLSEYLFSEISSILESEKNCTLSLQGKSVLFSKVANLKIQRGNNEDLVFENALADDRKGYFFDKKIRVLSYELISPTKDGLELIESEEKASDEESIDKDAIKFIATLEFGKKREKLKKVFSLNFKADKDNVLTSCSLQLKSSSKNFENYWKSETSGYRLEKFSLKIGEDTKKNSLLSVNGGIYLESEKRVCREEIEGVMIVDFDSTLKFCRNGEWGVVGEQPVNWRANHKYTVLNTAKGQKTIKTKPHRVCFLRGQKRKTSSDQCKIEKEKSMSFKTSFKIVAKSTSLVTYNRCEVLCAD